MNFYDLMMSPLEKNGLDSKRTWLMRHVQGDVLEIGFGTGANMPYVRWENIQQYTALDLDNNQFAKQYKTIHFVKGNAAKLPFPDQTFDTVLETLVLCSVEDLSEVLAEISRVLKVGGHFVFMDHVLPTQPALASVFKIVNPLWSTLAHGCQLTRHPREYFDQFGFKCLDASRLLGNIFEFGIAVKL
jgi:ubiquinone/menaquinone biosynthesis C-methylase UbiE